MTVIHTNLVVVASNRYSKMPRFKEREILKLSQTPGNKYVIRDEPPSSHEPDIANQPT